MTEEKTLLELAPHKSKVDFAKAVSNAFTKFMDDPTDASERALEFFFNRLSIEGATRLSIYLQISDLAPRPVWDISPYLDDPPRYSTKG